MLDADLQQGEAIVKWATNYTKRFHLGSVLIMLTSEIGQKDILQQIRLDNFAIIFGKHIPYQEILWHNENAYKDGIIHTDFLEKRRLEGVTTERVTRKNREKARPRIYKYISNGDSAGCFQYLSFWIGQKKYEQYFEEQSKSTKKLS
jgi:hypothetical protein